MWLTLLGTGDSAGVPHVGCGCGTCRRYKEEGRHRTRFSLFIENDGESVLVDASPDLRFQFLREDIDSVDNVLLTHAHYDHYAGLGSLYRVVWNDLPIYGEADVLETVVDDKYGYLPFTAPVDVEPFEPFEVAGLEFTLLPVHHPPVDCYGFVVRDDDTKLAVTCDTSTMIPEESKQMMRDSDLLVADAFLSSEADVEYPEFVEEKISDDGLNFGGKHMTQEGALELADEVDAGETVLVHLSHYFRDDDPPKGSDGDVYEL